MVCGELWWNELLLRRNLDKENIYPGGGTILEMLVVRFGFNHSVCGNQNENKY